MLRVVLALAASGLAAQTATGIHLQEVRFKGDTHLDGVDLKECESDLKSQAYVGTDWIDYFVGTVQSKCLLDKGYTGPAPMTSRAEVKQGPQLSTPQPTVIFPPLARRFPSLSSDRRAGCFAGLSMLSLIKERNRRGTRRWDQSMGADTCAT